MAGFTLEKSIAAPPEVVFDTALDLRSAADNIRGIQKLEVLTDGPIGLGTRFRETRILFKKEATEVMEITAHERPSRYVLEAESHGTHYVTTYEFRPEGSGTRLALNFSGQPRTFGAKLLSLLFAFMIKACMKEVEKDLEDLKTASEARPGAA